MKAAKNNIFGYAMLQEVFYTSSLFLSSHKDMDTIHGEKLKRITI